MRQLPLKIAKKVEGAELVGCYHSIHWEFEGGSESDEAMRRSRDVRWLQQHTQNSDVHEGSERSNQSEFVI